MREEMLKALHCQKYHNILWKTEKNFPSINGHNGSSWLCQVCGNNFKTSWDTSYFLKKKTLKLIRPIQDHFPMSWVQKFSGFGFRCLKHTWIWMVIFLYSIKVLFQNHLIIHLCKCPRRIRSCWWHAAPLDQPGWSRALERNIKEERRWEDQKS